MITVSLNNQKITLADDKLNSAIQASGLEKQKFAVAINGDFIPRADYACTLLKNGDQIDIVSPVGGG